MDIRGAMALTWIEGDNELASWFEHTGIITDRRHTRIGLRLIFCYELNGMEAG